MLFFFFKQKTAYEMRISDWSSDVCSSDLIRLHCEPGASSTDFELYIDGQFADSGTVAFEVRAPRTIKFGAGFTTPADPPVMTDRRSEERRVGKEWVRTFRSRWSPYN